MKNSFFNDILKTKSSNLGCDFSNIACAYMPIQVSFRAIIWMTTTSSVHRYMYLHSEEGYALRQMQSSYTGRYRGHTTPPPHPI